MEGPVISAVRADIADLGPLTGRQRSLAQAALRLAKSVDESGHENTARELRITMGELFDLHMQGQLSAGGQAPPSGVGDLREARERRQRNSDEKPSVEKDEVSRTETRPGAVS